MLPPKESRSPEQRRLLRLFRELSREQRGHLLSYAEFLHSRKEVPAEREPAPAVADEPVAIPRPTEESVVAAIRRLSETFPMLDREALLHETSALMSAHVMQGQAAGEVIDQLEVLFRRHYERQNSV